MHRLETIDPGLYARLQGRGEGPRPDRSEAWRTTLVAAQMALDRAGTVPDVVVPQVIREVLSVLGQGVPVLPAKWKNLRDAHLQVLLAGAGLRPGRIGLSDSWSAEVTAYHGLARLVELLLLWDLESAVDGPGVKYAEIAYLAGQIQMSPRLAVRRG